MTTQTQATERHFTVKELAEAWKLSEGTIRKLFQDEPGVLKIGNLRPRRSRAYISLRIPESVASRIHGERTR